jgi:hypothetical protein
MFEKHRLHFSGIDILATGNDEIAASVVDEEPPVSIDRSYVSSVEPAVVQNFTSRNGLIPITLRHSVTSHTNFTRSIVREGPTRFVLDLDFGASQRTESRIHRVTRKPRRDLRRGFSEPIRRGYRKTCNLRGAKK